VKKISSLKEQLLEDMKLAMKNKEKEKLSVIKTARAAIKNLEIEKRKDLEDDEVLEVLQREIEERREAIKEYENTGEKNMLKKLNQEIEILAAYLPEK
jgi:uncharacterized protein YqeY